MYSSADCSNNAYDVGKCDVYANCCSQYEPSMHWKELVSRTVYLRSNVILWGDSCCLCRSVLKAVCFTPIIWQYSFGIKRIIWYLAVFLGLNKHCKTNPHNVLLLCEILQHLRNVYRCITWNVTRSCLLRPPSPLAFFVCFLLLVSEFLFHYCI